MMGISYRLCAVSRIYNATTHVMNTIINSIINSSILSWSHAPCAEALCITYALDYRFWYCPMWLFNNEKHTIFTNLFTVAATLLSMLEPFMTRITSVSLSIAVLTERSIFSALEIQQIKTFLRAPDHNRLTKCTPT